MKKAFILFFLLVEGVASAQNYSYIDSLTKELQVSEGSSRANLYLDIAWEYRKSNPDSTIYYSDRAMDLADQIEASDRIKAKALNFKGVAYHYLGDNLKSFEFYNMAIEVALQKQDSTQYAHALNSLGRTYLNQGDFLKAYDYYFKALGIFERFNDQQGLGYCYKSLSELYQTQENFDKALEMSEKTLQIRLNSGNIHGQISILNEIAFIYKQKGNFDRAFDFYLQAKIKAESIDDQISIANINLGIAALYADEQKYDDALVFADKAYNTAKTKQNLSLLGGILLQLGKVHYELENETKALSYLLETIEVSQKSQELALLQDAHFYISEIYKRRGNYKLAYEYHAEYSELSKKLSSTEVARTIERFESRLEIEKKDRENELLVSNQARDQAVIERQRIQNIALLVISVVILILGANLFITGRKRKRANLRLHEKNQRIAIQREEITAQNDQISKQNLKLKKRNEDLAEINNEKNTLMNIVAHDLKSPFNRIKGLVELLKLSGMNKEQGSYVTLLEDISNGGVDLIRDLLDVNAFEEDKRKPEISRIDVHTLLLEKAKLFYSDAKEKGIDVKTPNAENHLFYESDQVYLSRILDNLISNAIKFSDDNSEVTLNAGITNNHIFISVKDQGPGFSEDDKQHLYTKFKKLSARPTAGESSNGLGLAIVKTLVERLEGEIELKSKMKEGSEFIIKFPTNTKVASTTSK